MTHKKLKITICSYDGKDYFGGPYEWVKRFGLALRTVDVEVSFLFFSDHNPSCSSTYQYLKERGFDCQILPHHSFSQYHDNTEDRVRWCLQQVRQNPPDVFIANAVLPALFAGRWIKQAGIPVIGVLHTDDVRHEWLFEEFVSASKEFCVSALVCVSEMLREKVVSFNTWDVPVEVISCGTPIPTRQKIKDASPLKIVYAGKLTEEAKQISLLAKAFCRAVNEIEEIEAYVYGDGPAKKNVQSILEQEDLGHRVHYEGFVSSMEIQEKLADKHVIVLLSDYEGLPIILMEAMACGLVPVCLNIRSGIPELVKQEETGLLVNDRDGDFIQAIKKLKTDSTLLQKLSAQALHEVNKHHAMSIIVDKWLLLVNQLVKDSSKSAVEIPDRMILPSVNKHLKGIDERKDSLIRYVGKQWLRIRRNIL
ncbi:MAG TPA: glycosyltransferase family 4 protein [Cytophagaceae bacterium]|jgi:colanic acid/amylovoran biosynthesis glycosyltransferase|nr:glycosyltransferase family 4 protein [Cytophagaceae bacterium]